MNKQLFRVAGIALFALLACTGLSAQTTGVAASGAFEASAQKQAAAIYAAKASFTPAQKKMSSNLVFGIMAANHDPRVADFAGAIGPVGASDPSVAPHPGGRPTLAVTVNIYGRVTDSLLSAIAAAKGVVVSQSVQWGVVTASLPLISVETIAGLPAVTRIGTPARAHTNAGERTGSGTRVIAGDRTNGTPHTSSGLVTSQGYIAHEANKVVNSLGITGAGVTVGVLSDSASPGIIAALIASGDLPVGAHALPGQSGPTLGPPENGTDEGAAIMEIVHDMAPGAQILFATAFISEESFADNIIALANAGCKVIVDDVSYSDEGVFQDGIIAQAVNQVTAMGVIYFSSAANSGSKTFNTSGTWEGDFLSGGPVSGPIAAHPETGLFHNFRTAGSPQNYDVLTAASEDVTVSWSDPYGASANDYDLFILNSSGTSILDFSTETQDGTGIPIEEVFNNGPYPAGSRVVVVLHNGSPRALHVDTFGALLSINTQGSTHGHNAGLNSVSMAATSWNSAHGGTQPFTGGAANPNENFSSDGPRKIFFNPDGTAITPGNYLFGTDGGTTLVKPDLAAADGGSALTPGFNPFYGTSAAAPHAASIAALILQARPDYTVAQIKAAMVNTALDTMGPGPDRDSGYGITMAKAAVLYAQSH